LVDIKAVSHENLISRIEHIWEEREHVANLLRARVPKMKIDVKNAMTSALSPYIRKQAVS
jgi:hypothetical protein